MYPPFLSVASLRCACRLRFGGLLALRLGCWGRRFLGRSVWFRFLGRFFFWGRRRRGCCFVPFVLLWFILLWFRIGWCGLLVCRRSLRFWTTLLLFATFWLASKLHPDYILPNSDSILFVCQELFDSPGFWGVDGDINLFDCGKQCSQGA